MRVSSLTCRRKSPSLSSEELLVFYTFETGYPYTHPMIGVGIQYNNGATCLKAWDEGRPADTIPYSGVSCVAADVEHWPKYASLPRLALYNVSFNAPDLYVFTNLRQLRVICGANISGDLTPLSNLHALTVHGAGVALSCIASLSNLVELAIESCNLHEIPSEVFQLTGLKNLRLCDNQIHRLPRDLSQMRKLKMLNLVCNRITEIPAFCRHIREVTCAHNPVVRVHPYCYYNGVRAYVFTDCRLADRLRKAHYALYGELLEADRDGMYPETVAFIEALEWVYI